jgi:DNA-binding MarR family transcriptional regulator
MTRDDVFELQLFLGAVNEDIVSSASASGLPRVQLSYLPVLCALAEGNTRVGDVAERLGITQQAVGKTLRHMAKDTFITIDTDKKDKRARVALLTNQGRSLLTVFDAVSENWDAE